MRRREFLALGGATAAAWPLAARAQSPSKVPHLGVLMWGSPSQDYNAEPFRQGMREFGYVEGQNIVLNVHFAEGSTDRAAASVREFVAQKVDVIVASTTPAAHIAKGATTTIPIVMAPVSDPLATGLVTNLARPGGNLTGVTDVAAELTAKRLEVLHEILPGIGRLAFLGSIRDPNAQTFLRQSEIAGATFRIRVEGLMVNGPDEFETAFSAMVDRRCEAVVVQPIFANERATIADLALRHALPTVRASREFAAAGLLIAYGTAIRKILLQAAGQIDKILKGAKAGDLPVEQPTHFELAINLKTANALGLTIPATLLARADDVIE